MRASGSGECTYRDRTTQPVCAHCCCMKRHTQLDHAVEVCAQVAHVVCEWAGSCPAEKVVGQHANSTAAH